MGSIKATEPISILIKLVDYRDDGKGVGVDDLFEEVFNAREEGIHLYDFHLSYEGGYTSDGFWKDIEKIEDYEYAKISNRNIKLTEDGKELANWLELSKPMKEYFIG